MDRSVSACFQYDTEPIGAGAFYPSPIVGLGLQVRRQAIEPQQILIRFPF